MGRPPHVMDCRPACDRSHVGTILAIHLDGHEEAVHERGDVVLSNDSSSCVTQWQAENHESAPAGLGRAGEGSGPRVKPPGCGRDEQVRLVRRRDDRGRDEEDMGESRSGCGAVTNGRVGTGTLKTRHKPTSTAVQARSARASSRASPASATDRTAEGRGHPASTSLRALPGTASLDDGRQARWTGRETYARTDRRCRSPWCS